MKHYDYLIVGSGLFGATFAYKARQAGKTCLVIDKRPHLGGNIYCEPISLPTEKGCGEAVIFGGRLAEYRYYDMAPIIEKVLDLWKP